MCVCFCVCLGETGDVINKDVETQVRQSERFGRWAVIEDRRDMEERRQRGKKVRYKLNMS